MTRTAMMTAEAEGRRGALVREAEAAIPAAAVIAAMVNSLKRGLCQLPWRRTRRRSHHA